MSHARRVLDYYDWLLDHGIEYGFDLELARLCARDGNGAPDRAKWERILPTLAVLTLVRERFGPTTINSGYRSPSYNAHVGGARNSQHVANRAIDFKCATGTPREWAEFLSDVRDADVFSGGIGTYRTFVHIDTRGANVDWRG